MKEKSKELVLALDEYPEAFIYFLRMLKDEVLSLPVKKSIKENFSSFFSEESLARIFRKENRKQITEIFNFLARKFSDWEVALLFFLNNMNYQNDNIFLQEFIPKLFEDLHVIKQSLPWVFI